MTLAAALGCAGLALVLSLADALPRPASAQDPSQRARPADYRGLLAQARAYVAALPSPIGGLTPEPAVRWELDRERRRITIVPGDGATVEGTAGLIGVWSPGLGEFFLADRASSYPPEMTTPAHALRMHANAHGIDALADHHPVPDLAAAADRAAIAAYLTGVEAVFSGSREDGLVFFLTLSKIRKGGA